MSIEPGSMPTTRRYYRLRRTSARVMQDYGLESTWQYLQEHEPGTVLPSDFPGRSKLITAGYTAVEDLQGSTADELITNAGLSYSTAKAAIAIANA